MLIRTRNLLINLDNVCTFELKAQDNVEIVFTSGVVLRTRNAFTLPWDVAGKERSIFEVALLGYESRSRENKETEEKPAAHKRTKKAAGSSLDEIISEFAERENFREVK